MVYKPSKPTLRYKPVHLCGLSIFLVNLIAVEMLLLQQTRPPSERWYILIWFRLVCRLDPQPNRAGTWLISADWFALNTHIRILFFLDNDTHITDIPRTTKKILVCTLQITETLVSSFIRIFFWGVLVEHLIIWTIPRTTKMFLHLFFFLSKGFPPISITRNEITRVQVQKKEKTTIQIVITKVEAPRPPKGLSMYQHTEERTEHYIQTRHQSLRRSVLKPPVVDPPSKSWLVDFTCHPPYELGTQQQVSSICLLFLQNCPGFNPVTCQKNQISRVIWEFFCQNKLYFESSK